MQRPPDKGEGRPPQRPAHQLRSDSDEAPVSIVPAFTIASVNGARRTRQLTIAAMLLAEGTIPEPAWVRVQLLDLRDLLEAQEVA